MKQTGADMKLVAVTSYLEGTKSAKEVCFLYGITDRTLRRWYAEYETYGAKGLQRKKPKGRIHNQIPPALEEKILRLKQRNISWGARRVTFQAGLTCSWRTAHRVIKKHGLLVRIKAKPQPCKRFRRHHVDSLWQGDTFQFRIRDVGKVYVTGFTDDCSRYRIRSKTYLHMRADDAINALRWALKGGRVPRQIYLDNGKQFVARTFKDEARKHHIKLIFGKPYHPRGRGKIEAYHKVLHRELIAQKQFKSLSHFRRELWKFDKRWNSWRKLSALGWQTPASVYLNKRYFNKRVHKQKKRTFSLTTS
jgi:transposase InsO family protein